MSRWIHKWTDVLAIRDECTAIKQNHFVPFPTWELFCFCLFLWNVMWIYFLQIHCKHILLTLQILHDFCIHVCLNNFIMWKCLFFVLFGKYSVLICLKRTIIIIYLNYNSVWFIFMSRVREVPNWKYKNNNDNNN